MHRCGTEGSIRMDLQEKVRCEDTRRIKLAEDSVPRQNLVNT